MRKFLLIEGYLIGENELNEKTFKKKAAYRRSSNQERMGGKQ